MKKTLQLLNDGIADRLHPGWQLYVSHRGRAVIDTAGGLANVETQAAMTRDSVTLWMSAGKPITAGAALTLVERGLITLDTTVASVIPAFAQGNKTAITLLHLLVHTAGFRGPLNNFSPGTNDELVARACALRQEPGWLAGHKAGYHVASSWFVLGEIVRRIDGRRCEKFTYDEILTPIGATTSFLALTAAVARELGEHLALTYITDKPEAAFDPDFAGNTPEGMTVCRPGASARGPVRELAKFYEALLAGGGPVLNESTATLMTSRVRENQFDHTFKQVTDWGLGLKLDSKRYGTAEQYGYGAHASDQTYGHSGNQTACAYADPVNSLVVAWLCNGMPGEAKHQVRQHALNTAIYEDLELA